MIRKVLILLAVFGLLGVFGVFGKVEASRYERMAKEADGYELDECRIFEGLKQISNLHPDKYPVMMLGFFEGKNRKYTETRGDFRAVMRKRGIVLGQEMEKRMQAGYGVIAENIMIYVGDNTERATLLKTAALEIERRTQPKHEANDTEMNAIFAFTMGHIDKGGYRDNLVFTGVILHYLFPKTLDAEIRVGVPGANYFPDTKKELIRALFVGNFEAVDNLLSREKIRTAHGLWKSTCERAFELRGGKKWEK